MAYSGYYTPINPDKYELDYRRHPIVYRSWWEYQVFRWCDLNDRVVSWSSESVVVPYVCKTDGRPHRYFVDVKIKFRSGSVLLVEIKPKAQAQPPKPRKRQTRKSINEGLTWAKNVSKWQAAEQYAYERGWTFQVWTETTLKQIGIMT